MKKFNDIKNLQEFKEIVNSLKKESLCDVRGLWGAAAGLMLAELQKKLKRPFLIITNGEEECDLCVSDLTTFGEVPVEYFPSIDVEPGDMDFSGMEIIGQRAKLLRMLLNHKKTLVRDRQPLNLVTTVRAIMQPLEKIDHYKKRSVELKVGDEFPPEKLKEWLVDNGYKPEVMVSLRGEFSTRGGILDVFPVASDRPLRIEFFGDTIESIRQFDQLSQRSVGDLKACLLEPFESTNLDDKNVSLMGDYLHSGWIVVWLNRDYIELASETIFNREDDSGLVTLPAFNKSVQKLKHLNVYRDKGGDGINLDVISVQRFENNVERAVAELKNICSQDASVVIYFNNLAEKERLVNICIDENFDLEEEAELKIGVISKGVCFQNINTYILADHEIFCRYRDRLRPVRKKDSAPITDFIELQEGDYVVHVNHGIGRYLGLKMLDGSGQKEEYMCLLFAEATRVFVPVSNIHLVQKYVGRSAEGIKLDRIGGKVWARRKKKVEEALEQMAEELVELQAVRATQPGIQYSQDCEMQRKFEASFIYEETPDQLAATDDIKDDMMKNNPMDRLLCGDVGFGKTEVAIRAAFKAVLDGKQVAVLVPTTILAEQHFRSFYERLAEYPIVVNCLSRFRSKGVQSKIIQELLEGTVDIVIGTHRLLSKDVEFADLGLVIIDEEQKFGVKHKEKFKHLRNTIDVLTLSATPIPRTLHMALLGIKDISSLTVPPADRLAIITKVVKFDEKLIRHAIIRELNRDGQVFFLHNRVLNIGKIKKQLEFLVPEAKFEVAHGQMPEKQLKKVMEDFVDKKIDVLVTTTIIESGVDIPNVNTLIVNNAHNFGLADLHQLRGRIGRYRHRAFAYLMIPKREPITDISRRRLQAIEEFSELGAGFQLAMKDLEIRGAGNILGKQQSGHIESVGYDLYCSMLDKAVRRIKGDTSVEEEEFLEKFEVKLKLGLNAYIPNNFIREPQLKIDLYRKIDTAKSTEDFNAVREEVLDRYGQMPYAVKDLIDTAEVRLYAKKALITAIEFNGSLLILTRNNIRETDFMKRIGLRDKDLEYLRADQAAFKIGQHEVADYLLELLPRLID